MIKLIAFDWNGTLLSDTAPTLRAENAALKAIGAKPLTLKQFQRHFDIPITKYWASLGFTQAFIKKHIETIEDVFHITYEKNSNRTRTRSGAKELLIFLKQKNISAVIYSNHNVPNIRRQLVRLKIEQKFREILANAASTDNPQVFNRNKDIKLADYIKKNKIKPGEVVSIGDTEEEIHVGKKYGYHTIAISGGYNTIARLKKQKPDFLIHNLAEVKNIVTKLNNR